MKFLKEMLRLYAVTDQAWVGRQTLLEQIEEALQGGATMVQLREKELDGDAFLQEAVQVRELCHRYHVPLIINDNVDVARKSNADGVHVGVQDTPAAQVRAQTGPEFIIGVTAKTVEQARLAWESGADYIGVGAVFPSPTKKKRGPRHYPAAAHYLFQRPHSSGGHRRDRLLQSIPAAGRWNGGHRCCIRSFWSKGHLQCRCGTAGRGRSHPGDMTDSF